MAFAEITRYANTVARTSAQTATANLTITAPTSGQWIAVALYTNRGNIPNTVVAGSNNQVTTVACGSVNLTCIDSPTASSQTSPTLFMAPYTAGMSTNLAITWTNNVATTNLAVCMLIFTGADTTNTSGYAAFRTASATGAFDGGGTSTFGSGYAAASIGTINWTNSSAVPTNYGNQRQPFIAAIVDTNIPTSATLQLARCASVFGVIADSAGNVYAAFGTPGTLPINSTTGVYNPSGGVAYGVVYGDYGNFAFSYTGISGGSLTGCTIISNPLTTDTNLIYASSYAPIMLAGTSAVTITALLATDGGTNLERISGFLTGKGGAYFNASAGTTQQGHVMIGAGGTGTTPCRLHLMGGTFANDMRSQPVWALNRLNGTNLTNGGGVIYTMVPSTRTITDAGGGRVSPLVRGSDTKGLVMSSAVVNSPTTRGSNLVTRILSAASTATQQVVSDRIVDLVRSASSSVSQSVVGVNFKEIVQSAGNALTQSTAGGKLVGFVTEGSAVIAQAVEGAKTQAISVASAVFAEMQVNATKFRELATTGSAYLSQSASAVKEQALNVLGIAVATGAISAIKVAEMVTFGYASLDEEATSQKIAEQIRGNSAVLYDAAVASKAAEMARSGVATETMQAGSTSLRERLVSGVVALSAVGRATKQAVFSTEGIAELRQATSFASYVYTIAHTINVAFSENTEKGLYRESSTAVSFSENTRTSYQEGRNHQ